MRLRGNKVEQTAGLDSWGFSAGPVTRGGGAKGGGEGNAFLQRWLPYLRNSSNLRKARS